MQKAKTKTIKKTNDCFFQTITTVKVHIFMKETITFTKQFVNGNEKDYNKFVFDCLQNATNGQLELIPIKDVLKRKLEYIKKEWGKKTKEEIEKEKVAIYREVQDVKSLICLYGENKIIVYPKNINKTLPSLLLYDFLYEHQNEFMSVEVS